MGRHYYGDIEGKFWFGVQSSDDGEFFGATCSAIDYSVNDIEEVEEGIKKCHIALGNNLARLDDFFNSKKGRHKDEMIIDWWEEKYSITLTSQEIRRMLEWYARLALGKQIFEYMSSEECDGGACFFSAGL